MCSFLRMKALLLWLTWSGWGQMFWRSKIPLETQEPSFPKGKEETSALLGAKNWGSACPRCGLGWEETHSVFGASTPERHFLLQAPPACTLIHWAPATPPPLTSVIFFESEVCLWFRGRRQHGLEGQRLGLAQIRTRVSLDSSLLGDLEQAILPLCASVSSAVMGTPSTGHGSYCCYLLTSLKSSDHWGRRKLGDEGVYRILTTGPPRQQKFTIKGEQMKGFINYFNEHLLCVGYTATLILWGSEKLLFAQGHTATQRLRFIRRPIRSPVHA